MLHFFGQLLVTLWPVVLTVSFLPLTVLFYVGEITGRVSVFFQLLQMLSMTLFGCLGFVFLTSFLVRFVPGNKSFAPNITRSAKLALFFSTVGIAYFLMFALDKLKIQLPEGPYMLIILVFIFGGAASLFWYLLQGAIWIGSRWVGFPKWCKNVLKALAAMAFFYPFLVVIVILSWLFWDPLGSIADYRMHTLHAAIKNTCILDPAKENCPQQLEDLRRIEPKIYDEVADCCQMKYTYDPATNQYVFVVRYSPVQAAVFSQRFLTESKWGTDYKETEVTVWGTDRVVDPLLPGDWTFPEWKYRLMPPRTLY